MWTNVVTDIEQQSAVEEDNKSNKFFSRVVCVIKIFHFYNASINQSFSNSGYLEHVMNELIKLKLRHVEFGMVMIINSQTTF